MKRAYLFFTILAIAATYLFFNNGCKKVADTTPPLILLKGANPYYQSLDTVYVDPGAIAQDNVDGNISSKIVVTGAGSVNTSKKGVFNITYSVTNSAGLTYTATRTVYVWNIADSLAGSFWAVDSCLGTWPDSVKITTSNTINGQMTFYNILVAGDSVVGTLHNVLDTLPYTDTIRTITFNTPVNIGGNNILESAIGIVSVVDTSFTITGFPITSRVITLYYKWYDGISYDSCHAVF